MNRGSIKKSSGSSKQKQAKKIFWKGEDWCEVVSTIANTTIIIMSDKGEVVFWNPFAEKLFGYTSKEIIGKPLKDFIIPEELRKKHEKALTLFKKEGTGLFVNRTVEVEGLKKNGNRVSLELSIAPIKKRGHWYAVASILDISERYKIEKSLNRVHEYAQSLIDSSFDMIIAVDKDRNIVEFNSAAQKSFGYRKKEVLGKNIKILYSDPDQAKIPADVLHDKGYFSSEVLNRRKNGELFKSIVTATLIKDSQGNILGTMGVSRDITDRIRKEEELRKAKMQAEAASKSKDEFFANMTHEIRTPLNAIIGHTELGIETDSPAEMKQYLASIKDSADFLLTILNSVLVYSKLEANRLELNETEFNFRMAVENITQILSAQAHRKDIELLCHINPDVPKYLIGDSTQLKQIMVNIIGNAIKFTEKGKIIVDVRLNHPFEDISKKIGEKIELLFSIKDTGIGIPENKVNSIFKSFAQVDSSMTRKYGGTGLGLTIARRLVKLMKGNINVHSELGKGSNFYFTILLEKGLKTWQTKREWDLTGKRVLVIGRDEMFRFILREMLEEWDFDVNEAESNLSGFNELQSAFAEGNPYHLTIFDSRMPDGSGFKIAQMIKDNPSFTSNSVILLNTNHRSGDIDKIKEMGLTGYLLKPVKQVDLQKLIAKTFDLEFSVPSDEIEESISKEPIHPIQEAEYQGAVDTLPQKTPFFEKWEKPLTDMEVISSPDTKDESLIRKRRSFVNTMAARIDMLEKMVGDKKIQEIGKMAREIKEEALEVGGILLQNEAFRIILASTNEDFDRCKILFERLVKVFKMTKDIINRQHNK